MIHLLTYIFFANAVHASMNFCDVIQDAKTIKTIPMSENINFFIRGAHETKEIGFATSKGNFLLDSKTGKKIEVPGDIDPILTPDGKILSVPQSMLFDPKTKTFGPRPKNYKGLEIYQGRVTDCKWNPCSTSQKKIADIEASNEPYVMQVMTFYLKDSLEKPVLIDRNTNYSYQSFGKLRKNGSITTYRMLFETQEGIRARDYTYDESSKTFSSNGPVKPLCGGLRGSLPAQSKSGDEYSAYDAEKGVTHIFSIGKSGLDCKITETLPGMVGKVDFSPDGKRLAYHVDKIMDNNQTKNIIKSADEKSSIESVVFDRKTKKPAIVAKSSNTNSYYPIFLDDNTIAYIDSTKTNSEQQKPQFQVKLAKLEEISTPNCSRCYEHGTSEEQIAAFVGAIRDRTCEEDPRFYFKNGIPSFSSIRVSQCQSVVESCDSKCMDQIKKKIERVSGGGGFMINGISLKANQNWNLELISKLEKKDLSNFCNALVRENSVTSKETTTEKATQ